MVHVLVPEGSGLRLFDAQYLAVADEDPTPIFELNDHLLGK
jgi:hypothetical protein